MRVSIIIPVKNGMHWLRRSLPVFLDQSIEGDFELIIIDSGSTDGLKEFLMQYNSKKLVFHAIEPSTFNHGATRNLGVNLAKGKYVVLTVQDAKPSGNNWLAEMLNGFVDDDVVAVCGKQIVPHDVDKNPVQWYKNYSAEGIQEVKLNPEHYLTLNGVEKYSYAALDNVSTCYLREKLIQQPFRNIEFAEDVCWANDALEKGWAIVYNGKAKVEHYHFAEAKYLQKRLMVEWYCLNKILGFIPSPPLLSFKTLLSWLKLTLCNRRLNLYQRIFWLRHNLTSMKVRKLAYKEWMYYFCKGDLNTISELYLKEIPLASAKPRTGKSL